MKRLLTFVMILGVLLLPGPFGVQVAAPQVPEAPEAGEVEFNQPTLPTNLVDFVNRQFFTNGVRTAVQEVEFRGLAPTSVGGFLSTDAAMNDLVKIGGMLPPNTKVDFRTMDGQRFRVQNEDGQLRVRLRDVAPANAQALAQAFSIAGFGRVEIRTLAGNRLEFRDRVMKKDEVKPDRSGRGHEGTSASINNSERARDRGQDLDHSIRGRDRASLERDRVERSGRQERMERPERHGRH